jgi:hypothetical protein
MEFVPGMGLLGKLMVPMMKMQFKPRLQSVLDGSAAYVERGQHANATPAPKRAPEESATAFQAAN